MSEKMRGADVLVKVNTGTTEVPVWTTIGGQRDARVRRGTDSMDTTTKDSEGAYREEITTFINWTVSCDGLIVKADAGATALRNAWRNRDILQVEVMWDDTGEERGPARLESLEEGAPYEDSATYSAELRGVGPLEPEV